MQSFMVQMTALRDIQRAAQSRAAVRANRQRVWLRDFVRFVRASSPLYRELYSALPEGVDDLSLLPPVTKSRLMERLDDWFTDPAITSAGIKAFLADKTKMGQPYLNQYLLYTSSGSTGQHMIFLQDHSAVLHYRTLNMLSLGIGDVLRAVRAGGRWVMIAATTQEHLGSISGFKALERSPLLKGLFRQVRILSLTSNLATIVDQLNEYQPNVIVGYSATLVALSNEQRAGRLHIHPTLIATGAEWVPQDEYSRIAATFQCRTIDTYAAAECPSLAFSCEQGYLHSRSDRFLLEPVDQDYQPVPPGRSSHTVLLTNLVNRVQPIIRYDLGDRMTVYEEPCPCGSPFPAMRIEGRKNDYLFLPGTAGPVTILPIAILELLNYVPGVQRFQIIQTSPTSIHIRLLVEPGADEATVWQTAETRLYAFLAEQGVSSVQVKRAAELPDNDPVSGKFRYVWNQVVDGANQYGVEVSSSKREI
jgi:phenylacetate-CoA ligase